MFLNFLTELRAAKVPASLKEHLTLLEALRADVIDRSVEQFYYLSRSCYVKDEGLLDRFDQVFGKVFKGVETIVDTGTAEIPEEWLRKVAELHLTAEEMAKITALGSWDEIMAALKQRLEEQNERHEGGSKWIGTGGTSPFGANGYNPEGIRIGQDAGRHGKAIKVWDKREFRNLDSTVELGTRNIKVALRRLRRFARDGAADELDMDATVSGTAKKAYLDIVMRPERHNAVKVLLFLDVGGSMDPISSCARNYSRRRGPNSSTSNSSTSTICRTRRCGRTTAAGGTSGRRRWTCSTSFRTTTSWCSSAMRR